MSSSIAAEMSTTAPVRSNIPDSTTETTSSWRPKKLYYNINHRNQKKHKNQNNHHLSVDKNIVDELLLVCGVIGSTEDPSSQKIVPVEDCLNWLQDLQRALRRDEDAYRPISLLLGQWKVVQQKLLPLVLSCRYDTPLVLTIVKILVILTKPLSETAMNAGRLIIDTKNRNVDDAVIEEQKLLRDNAVAQANLLNEYKRMFVHHPSHRKKRSSPNKKRSKKDIEETKGLLSIFVSLLAEPLSRTGMMRSNEDHLTVELILHLFRNLLCAGEPLFKDAENLQSSTKLHQELVALFEREMVLDILLVIGQEMESRENMQYNLLVMEILHHLLKNQDPTLVARSVLRNDTGTKPKNNTMANSLLYSNKFQGSQSSTPTAGLLMQQLKKERLRLHAENSSRHSHFGGTLVVQKTGGEQQYLTATTSKQHLQSRGRNPSHVNAKRKTKKHQHFIGSGRPQSAYYSRKGAVHSSTIYSGPASQCAQRVLHSFCTKFISQCYGPVMKSLKDEFRRDSARLEEEDKLKFFRIVWFFCQWRRVFAEESKSKGLEPKNQDQESSEDDSLSSVGNLVFTMDVFTFNLILSSIDYYFQHKKYKNLAQTVSLYTEMIRLLNFMYVSSDSMEKIMAMGLLDHLFYKSDPLDRLPRLLSGWIPATFTVEYLCDLVELTYATMKILDANEKACAEFAGTKEKTNKRGKDNLEEPQDRVTRMKERAAEFDTVLYFSRTLVSNQVVFMFSQVLSQYSTNAPRINDYIVSFFIRLCKFVLTRDEDFATLELELETNRKQVTLEPMLFNIHLFSVLNEILDDSNLRNDKDFRSVISFASTIVRHFAGASEKNPMLFVEALFRHPLAYRHCERVSNNYVSEELIMIAEREVLLGQSIIDSNHDVGDESSMGEEAELAVVSEIGGQLENRKLVKIPSDEEDNEMEFKDENENGSEEANAEEEFQKGNKIEHEKGSDEKSIISSHGENKDERKDDDDDRWNDRRKFVPKRRLHTVEQGKEHMTQQNEHDKLPSLAKKRIKRTLVNDSSDEEEFSETKITTISSQQNLKPNFYDSDSEED